MADDVEMNYVELIDQIAELIEEEDSDYIPSEHESDTETDSDYDMCSCEDSSCEAETISSETQSDSEIEYYECDHDENHTCDKCISTYIKEIEEDELKNHLYFIDDSDLIVEQEVKHIGELFK